VEHFAKRRVSAEVAYISQVVVKIKVAQFLLSFCQYTVVSLLFWVCAALAAGQILQPVGQ